MSEKDNSSSNSNFKKKTKKKEIESSEESNSKKENYGKSKKETDQIDTNEEMKEDSNNSKKEEDITKDIIHQHFVLIARIGHGAFGEIYLSYNLRDYVEVAIKREEIKPDRNPQLRNESKVYQSILDVTTNDCSGEIPIVQQEVQGFPKFYGLTETSEYHYLILQFLGPNLMKLLEYCKTKKFTVVTVCLIALQMLNRIEHLHKKQYIHRDIKPENFLIGTENNSNIIYLIDYGLAKRYKSQKTNQHIPYREGRSLAGTARYVSINTHLGIEQSRRDDLESIGYVLIYFLNGRLPWQGCHKNAQKDEKYEKIMEKKLQIPTEILCLGLPNEFTVYLNYCKNLRFEDRPDYDYLRGLFLKLLANYTLQYNLSKETLKFDWCFEDQKELWQKFNDERNKISNYGNKLLTQTINSGTNLEAQKLQSDMGQKLNEILESTKTNKKMDVNLRIQKKEKSNSSKEENESKNLTNKEDNKDTLKSNNNEKINYCPTGKFDDVRRSFEDKKEEGNIVNNVEETKSIEEKESEDDTVEKEFNAIDRANSLNKCLGKDLIEEMKNPKNYEKIDKYISSLLKNNKKLVDVSKININSNKISVSNISSNRGVIVNYKNEESDFKSNIQESKIKSNQNKTDEQKTEKISDTSRSSVQEFKYHSEIHKEKGKHITPKSLLDKNNISYKSNNASTHVKLAKENLIKISKEPITKYYEVYNELGQGSYGKVKKVKHIKLNEYRAMKVVSKRSSSSQNEIEILRKISHPNIVNIFEIFEDKRHYYIMSEYCEGGELFDAITNKGNYKEVDAINIFKQILLAVNYLHNRNIVHRDLKPENIMLIEPENKNNIDKTEIKLIDFGTACIIKKGQKLKKFIGTSYYLAPEVLHGSYNEKCDVWSCGVILYILLCGYPPFNGNSRNEIFSGIQNKAVQFYEEDWRDISTEAVDLIKKMLDKNPYYRPSCNQCLNHNWFKLAKDKKLAKSMTLFNNKLNAVKKMAIFSRQNKLKQAVLQFISTEFNLKKEEEELKKIFKEFDKEQKGSITKETFINQIDLIDEKKVSREVLEDIFNSIDLDFSGAISYNEFLTSIIDNKKILTEERLRRAFNMFDLDNDKKLSVSEIRKFFGGDENTWKKVLKEVDNNGDGQVDFEEFKKMMNGFDQNNFEEYI